MGADIHSFAEVKIDSKWVRVEDPVFSFGGDIKDKSTEPFSCRNYSIFGFLANVRNYSESESLSNFRGLPKDSEWLNKPVEDVYMYGIILELQGENNIETTKSELLDSGYHSFGYLTLKEIVDFDYSKILCDKRDNNQYVNYRDFLGHSFFSQIEELKTLGDPKDVRIIFWFDS